MFIKINEIFGPTIQGEGKSVGKRVAFVRTSFCNLVCVWCDTPYTWNWEGTSYKHNLDKKYSKSEEIHEMSVEEVFQKVQSLGVDAVVISGGEPCVQHKALVPLIQKLKENGYWVEVETNGTMYPEEMFSLVDQINCSPKLSNAGNPQKKAEIPEVLRRLAKDPKVNFKFVIGSADDEREVARLVELYEISPLAVYLMPLGMTVSELCYTRTGTQELAKKYGFNFSDRLHIVKLGGGRGV